MVELGNAGLMFVYDELEADTSVTWSYLLHTAVNKMEIANEKEYVRIRAINGPGASDAYLFSPDLLKTEQTNQFFYPAVNWLRADDKGYFAPFENHWHFTSISPARKVYRFATIISTHQKDVPGAVPQILKNGLIKVGSWVIKANISSEGKASFSVKNAKENVSLIYDNVTIIKEGEKQTTLKDRLPELEI